MGLKIRENIRTAKKQMRKTRGVRQMDQSKESCQPTDKNQPTDEPWHCPHSIPSPHPHTGAVFRSVVAQGKGKSILSLALAWLDLLRGC